MYMNPVTQITIYDVNVDFDAFVLGPTEIPANIQRFDVSNIFYDGAGHFLFTFIVTKDGTYQLFVRVNS